MSTTGLPVLALADGEELRNIVIIYSDNSFAMPVDEVDSIQAALKVLYQHRQLNSKVSIYRETFNRRAQTQQLSLLLEKLS